MSWPKGKKPTHRLVMKPKGSDQPGARVGVAWEGVRGNPEAFSIVLDRGVTISWRDCEDHYLGIFPVEVNDEG